VKLIDNWRQCHKFWSVRLQLAGVFLLGALQEFPDAVAHIWLVLPAEIHAAIPDDALRWIGYACLAAGILARIVRQERLHQTQNLGLGGEGQRGIPRDAV